MGHSYGTILGSRYVLSHPEKVSDYVSVAQVVSLEKSDMYSYKDALNRAQAAGDDLSALEAAYQRYADDPTLVNLMAVRSEVSKYHTEKVSENSVWYALFSPYYGMDDFRWFLKQIGSMEDYFAVNKPLFDYTKQFNADNYGMEYAVPVYFISGSDDWICPVDSVKNYCDSITAPKKGNVSH